MKVEFPERFPHGTEFLFRQTDRRCRQPSDFDHIRSETAAVDRLASRHIVRSNTPLPIRRSSQRNRSFAAEDRLNDFHDVACRKNIGIGSPKMRIHDHVSARSAFQTSFLGQPGIGTHSSGDDDQIRPELFAAVQLDLDTLRRFDEIFHRAAKSDPDSRVSQFVCQRVRHFVVQRRQNVVSALNDRHVQTAFPQVFCRFQPNEPCTDDDRTFRSCQLRHYPIHIAERPERKNAGVRIFRILLNSGRHGPCRQKQCIVRFRVFAVRIAHRHAFCRAVDPEDFILWTNIYPKPRCELCRRHDQQTFTFRDHTSYMVR